MAAWRAAARAARDDPPWHGDLEARAALLLAGAVLRGLAAVLRLREAGVAVRLGDDGLLYLGPESALSAGLLALAGENWGDVALYLSRGGA